ncbi:hypothetical protein [Fredinandcohnia sp. 179-A 10B2 NHS]|uniref:hypothetical protein n=1 Tax=Fredinandcohnia sp. 179-A 10B2 NHS TaxID=3235176 RepID=UPI0039A22A4F
MKLLKLIPFFLIMLLISACNKEELNWYGVVIFKPVEVAETTWNAELQYVDYSEVENTPPDLLRITCNHDEENPGPVAYRIPGTSIEGMIEVSQEGSGEAVIERTKLEEYIETIILEDGTIIDSIPLVLSWGSETEILDLPYLTAIKDFEKTIWDRILATIFS